MNLRSALLLVSLLATSNLRADEPLDSFLKRIQQSVDSHNEAALEACYCLDGMTASDLEQFRSMNKQSPEKRAKDTIQSITAIPLPPEMTESRIGMGKRYEPTLKPAGAIEIVFSSKSKSWMPYGIKAGTPLLVGVRIIDLGWKGPPDHQLSIAIDSHKATVAQKIRIKYTCNVSGVTVKKEQAFEIDPADPQKQPGSRSLGMNGQHFLTIEASTDSPKAEVKITLKEGQQLEKEVGKQEISASAPFRYERKS